MTTLIAMTICIGILYYLYKTCPEENKVAEDVLSNILASLKDNTHEWNISWNGAKHPSSGLIIRRDEGRVYVNNVVCSRKQAKLVEATFKQIEDDARKEVEDLFMQQNAR